MEHPVLMFFGVFAVGVLVVWIKSIFDEKKGIDSPAGEQRIWRICFCICLPEGGPCKELQMLVLCYCAHGRKNVCGSPDLRR